MNMCIRGLLVIGSVVIAGASTAANPEAPAAGVDDAPRQSAAAKTPAPAMNEARPAAGIRAYIDPETGRPAEPPQLLQPKAPRANEAPFPRRNNALMWTEQLGDGTLLLHTEGQVQMASHARFRSDGTIEKFCAPIAAQPESSAPAATVAHDDDASPGPAQ